MFFIVAFDAAYLKHVVIKMKLKAEVILAVCLLEIRLKELELRESLLLGFRSR